LVVGAIALAVVGAIGYWALLKPSSQVPKPKPGEVMALEPVQVNLAEGHFLKIGIALQLTEETAEVDGSKALDATIAQFSGTTVGELSKGARRQALKAQLERKVVRLYDDEVMGIYFVDFVTQ
jgi:flagellar FliL protein